ncbi:similar to Saccharomyces cerevisiae YIL107C PFK26 6-phosphofructo-2-kinase, inhibited by phosphoenolpyruvate and sn-glycerol 3-phosphate [Maudiozyma saulgeensis]|uniref:Similar to Saccharomyces cerevisiae YIL107C PFK26 6-phosphofructo-2-kinase, inhibited by phosphoenolpyruvate and sn-glycerol 3-phosphate n=1 Tax=Maudiozyma saulgeensis TaxID=1789683 RepID=A0A1X7RAI7_9SACH|nr:similar to Saccharomyces cerevisiae YIL107C PFK26 6-phosphofructo-2-kinase, inhibited by phosphoenolpyruvate and sn-glycerol 3-phosphate [Kazachstania saulgeensis]
MGTSNKQEYEDETPPRVKSIPGALRESLLKNGDDYFQRRPASDSPTGSNAQTPTGIDTSTPSPINSNIFINTGSGINTVETSPVISCNTIEMGIESPDRLRPTLTKKKRTPTTLDIPGLTKSKSSPDGLISRNDHGSKLVIIMVGIPATGKSFITKKVSRYLNYSMYHCKVFNVGNTRRRYTREHGMNEQDSNFFDPSDQKNIKLRDQWALDTLDELLDYLLTGNGSVAIFDATNTTKERRKTVYTRIRQRNDQLKVLFLESICTDRQMIDKNIQLKLCGPDYKGKNRDESLTDFKQRLENYDIVYEPMDDAEGYPYIKMINVGTKLISHRIKGFLASLTMYYLLNFNLSERQIWITRSGECEDNVNGKIGGDAPLTARGDKYAQALTKFIEEQRTLFEERLHQEHTSAPSTPSKNSEYSDEADEEEGGRSFFIWTSMLQRSIETGQYFDDNEYPTKQMKMLDEINAGDIDGLTFEQFRTQYPQVYEDRQHDKLLYRYPGCGGESYMDVSNRLRSVITEMERLEDNILLITHHVVARILLGYFMNLRLEVVTDLDIPLHSVYCLEPRPQGIRWALYEYDEIKDSFNKVPKSELNISRIKEIGLVHNERHYSLVPTAPSHLNVPKPSIDS